MASKRDRIFAGFFAGLFLFSASAFTITIIVQALQEKHDKSESTKTSQSATNTEAKKVDNSKRLQGTQLADFTPIAKVDQLGTADTVPGTGEEVKANQTLTVDYTGAIASTGKIFQSSKDTGQPATFPLNQVIKGWQEGIPGMKVGGTRRLTIPAALAYGSSSPSKDIPANADLVFDVTVHAAK